MEQDSLLIQDRLAIEDDSGRSAPALMYSSAALTKPDRALMTTLLREKTETWEKGMLSSRFPKDDGIRITIVSTRKERKSESGNLCHPQGDSMCSQDPQDQTPK